MKPIRRTLAAALVVLAACALDEAALIDPGTSLITADVGQIRVLRSTDDPEAGDAWIDVLTPDPDVVVEEVEFRESDSRHADDEERADRRRVFEAVGTGATVLVELNCTGCTGGIPDAAVSDVELQVWHFVVGDAGELRLGPAAPAPDEVHDVVVGDYVVVVRPASQGLGRITTLDSTVLRPVAEADPGDGPDLFVDVYLAVAPGSTELIYRLEDRTDVTYLVEIS